MTPTMTMATTPLTMIIMTMIIMTMIIMTMIMMTMMMITYTIETNRYDNYVELNQWWCKAHANSILKLQYKDNILVVDWRFPHKRIIRSVSWTLQLNVSL